MRTIRAKEKKRARSQKWENIFFALAEIFQSIQAQTWGTKAYSLSTHLGQNAAQRTECPERWEKEYTHLVTPVSRSRFR